jgi:hypothetical protein
MAWRPRVGEQLPWGEDAGRSGQLRHPEARPQALGQESPEPVADVREWGEHESIAELATAKKPGVGEGTGGRGASVTAVGGRPPGPGHSAAGWQDRLGGGQVMGL